jgi:hypothetical protein
MCAYTFTYTLCMRILCVPTPRINAAVYVYVMYAYTVCDNTEDKRRRLRIHYVCVYCVCQRRGQTPRHLFQRSALCVCVCVCVCLCVCMQVCVCMQRCLPQDPQCISIRSPPPPPPPPHTGVSTSSDDSQGRIQDARYSPCLCVCVSACLCVCVFSCVCDCLFSVSANTLRTHAPSIQNAHYAYLYRTPSIHLL